MRLWHQDLIRALPGPQLLGQHRECCALRGGGWGRRHSVVDYVFTHSPYRLFQYHALIMEEMIARGYNTDSLWLDPLYRGRAVAAYAKLAPLKVRKPLYAEHTDDYLEECFENLRGKGIHFDPVDGPGGREWQLRGGIKLPKAREQALAAAAEAAAAAAEAAGAVDAEGLPLPAKIEVKPEAAVKLEPLPALDAPPLAPVAPVEPAAAPAPPPAPAPAARTRKRRRAQDAAEAAPAAFAAVASAAPAAPAAPIPAPTRRRKAVKAEPGAAPGAAPDTPAAPAKGAKPAKALTARARRSRRAE